jgi:hypothetical protein
MSKNYHNICQNILQTNDDLNKKHSIQISIEELRSEMKIMSKKLDRIYNLLVNFINNKEF